MIRLYYLVWADCISRMIHVHGKNYPWKHLSMLFMSIAMAINFLLIMSILQRHVLGVYFYKLEFIFMPSYMNNIITFVTLFLFPCFIINHFLIFRNDRYLRVLASHSRYNGKLFLTFFMVSLSLPLILLGIAWYWG